MSLSFHLTRSFVSCATSSCGEAGCIQTPMNIYVGDELKHFGGYIPPLRRGRKMRVDELMPAPSSLGFSISSVRCHRTLATLGIERPQNGADSSSGQKIIIGKRWQDFFSDPSQWWDHRSEKENERYPDFRHKRSGVSLWLNGELNPPWVEKKLSAIPPGALQQHIFSWNKRLERCVKAGQYEEALKLYKLIRRQGLHPNKFTFSAIVKACSRLRALQEGKQIHKQITESGCGSDMYLSSGLVDMYARCGSIEDAYRVFNSMSSRDLVAWNAMIFGYAKCGLGQKALELSREMQVEGIEPDTVTFVGMLNACASISALEEGRHVHEQTIQRGFDCGIFVGSSLIDMYATCGSIDDAFRVFSKMPIRDVVCWNAIIHGYVKCGQGQKALDLSRQMEQEGLEPNSATFVGLLNACTSTGALEEGRYLHEQAIQRGLESGVLVGSSLIYMYTECGKIKDAWRVFNEMPIRDVVTWNAMIEGCVKCKRSHNALEIYQVIHREHVEPDINTFVGVLNACASLGALSEGRRVHAQTVERGLGSSSFVRVSLIHMYARCGSMEDAWAVFNEMPINDVDCFNAMIRGYVKCGQGHNALELYKKMQLESVDPDIGTFVGVLDACASVGAVEEGEGVHAKIRERGCESDVSLGNSLAKMYAKFRSIKDAKTGLKQIPPRHLSLADEMLRGLAMDGLSKKPFKG